jgi:hypothetical protein
MSGEFSWYEIGSLRYLWSLSLLGVLLVDIGVGGIDFKEFFDGVPVKHVLTALGLENLDYALTPEPDEGGF